MDSCYTIEKYKKSYEPIIYPMASMERWTRIEIDPIDPPLERCHLGRPKTQRKKGPTKPRNPYRFGKIGTKHNSKTCTLDKKKKSKTSTKV